ncbi:MAG: glycosyltransferase [Actinomycetota bacterium]|nr:glycosyltransferase [Actinomycetota bacterium]
MGTRFGFLSTYPPTQCGLATFTESLRNALVRSGTDEGHVVRLVDEPESRPETVVAQWMAGDQAGMHTALEHLNGCDVAIVQHEFGVFGGHDGEEILTLQDGLHIPCVVVLHTVLTAPTPHQREILELVMAKATALVVMTATAQDRLLANYEVDAAKLTVIAHGAPDTAHQAGAIAPTFRSGRSTILTWGLLGPGKGIEWGIEAMAMLRDVHPMPHYVIAGQTHPKVVLREGEAYRNSLRDRVRRLGLGDAVSFDAHYRESDALIRLVASADIVLLPYDSTDQVTSGVLIEAVAAGKPVVATCFPHARELLAAGSGLVVAHQDPIAIAAALRSVITRGDLAANMSSVAAASAPTLLWPAVAEEYRALASRLILASIAA